MAVKKLIALYAGKLKELATGDTISGAGLTDASVTKAKIENFTEGTLAGRKSAGAGVLEEVVSGIVLNSGTVSNAATLDISINSWYTLYDFFVIELISFIPATDNVDLWLRVSSDNSTYNSGATDYGYVMSFVNDGFTNSVLADASQSEIIMNGTGSHIGNSSSKPYNSTIKLYNPGSSALQPMVSFIAYYFNVVASGNFCVINGSGTRKTAQVTRAIRLLFSSGNISSGKWKLIGYKNS